MNTNKRTIAITELILLFPAALFMTALIVRNFQSLQALAQAAQGIVMWYAGRIWTLWILLIGLPMAALVIGGLTLLWNWNENAESRQSSAVSRLRGATLLIAVTTLVAGGILAVVAIHMLMN